MATAESVKTKIQGLIDKANETTGNADADLTTAVAALIEGFGAGGGAESTGWPYDMGEFVLDADTVTGANVAVPHALGAVPDFISVWTDHWSGLTEDEPVAYDDAKGSAAGFVWQNDIGGMYYRATSTATAQRGVTLIYQILNNDYRLNAVGPNSGAYGIIPGICFPTDQLFYGPTFGVNGPRFRAGVTYKYFVSKAWWNVREVEDAES